MRYSYPYHSKNIAYVGSIVDFDRNCICICICVFVFVYLYFCICIRVFVFACLTPGNIVFGVLVPRVSQKYSTCMVYTEFLISGRNPPLEGGGGKTYCKLEPEGHRAYLLKSGCMDLEKSRVAESLGCYI